MIRKIVWIMCDNCKASSGDTKGTVKEARKAAAATGWRIGREEDLCPYCATIAKELGQ